MSYISFEKQYQSLPPGTKILVMPQFSYMPDQILWGKNEKTQFSDKTLTFLSGPSLPKYKAYLKIF